MLGQNPEKYKGDEVADHAGNNRGECVSFVKICTDDKRPTYKWVQGKQVRGGNIPTHTAIATFVNGKYLGHAAIYISQNKDGILVWDQWKGHGVSQRVIGWKSDQTSNDGNSYYVID